MVAPPRLFKSANELNLAEFGSAPASRIGITLATRAV